MPEQPDVRAQLNALIPDEADRAALWKTAWDAYYEQYNAFRDANPGWRAFFSAHHSSALDAALEALLPQIIARGIAEGRRQATEGWERDLRYRWASGETMEAPGGTFIAKWLEAIRNGERQAGIAPGELQQRRKGPWEPAEERCGDCGLPVDETPARRDKRHDHCGPGAHTGDPGGCERCA